MAGLNPENITAEDVRKIRIYLHRLRVFVEEQHAMLDYIEAIHTQHPDIEGCCWECLQQWPCRTTRVLFGEMEKPSED